MGRPGVPDQEGAASIRLKTGRLVVTICDEPAGATLPRSRTYKSELKLKQQQTPIDTMKREPLMPGNTRHKYWKLIKNIGKTP